MWAHPRLRGADLIRFLPHGIPLGSSPLTRGGQSLLEHRSSRSRLIPAYAGRTDGCRRRGCLSWAHPRLRGADPVGRWGWCRRRGSSPLTRGGLRANPIQGCRNGLIPAYAGRTLHNSCVDGLLGAHPRLRGADASSRPDVDGALGSSPLTRGGQLHALITGKPTRLIPAYTGRTSFLLSHASVLRAHPRLRGADRIQVSPRMGIGGSSPLTRGGLGSMYQRARRGGLIPAYAGRTSRSFSFCSRGGLIPAYAGRTCRSCWQTGHPPAHPRLRGADDDIVSWGQVVGGSSPLTRGGRLIPHS
ncbi:Domain of uncharacterised function (DUF2825) [Corynebacterium striatum]|nr:hypothetical protein HMPREF0308_0804 [Corynebacterium striatum ATCC 6940]STD62682.1 Domain of uncharacterised function (DUF2825) [Corynebacterium striatum]